MSQDLVKLREITEADLPIFFEQMRDPEANYQAAFIFRDPNDLTAFNQHWAKVLAATNNINRTILYDNQVAGNIAIFDSYDEREVTYWLGKEFWGKGIATIALQKLLQEVIERPVYGRAAKDNFASIRVLEKCGFTVEGYNKDFANARNAEIEEIIMVLK